MVIRQSSTNCGEELNNMDSTQSGYCEFIPRSATLTYTYFKEKRVPVRYSITVHIQEKSGGTLRLQQYQSTKESEIPLLIQKIAKHTGVYKRNIQYSPHLGLPKFSKIDIMSKGGKREGSGRKPKPEGEARSELFSKRVTKAEFEKLTAFLESLRKKP